MRTFLNIVELREKELQISVGLNNYVYASIVEDVVKNHMSEVNFFVKNIDCALFKDSLALIKVIYSFFIEDSPFNLTEMELHVKIKEFFSSSLSDNNFYILIFRNFDCLFSPKIIKFIYTFLELFRNMRNIFVLGLTCKYDFLNDTDPRVISRFPKKVTFLDAFKMDNIELFIEQEIAVRRSLEDDMRQQGISLFKDFIWTNQRYNIQKVMLGFAGFSFKLTITTIKQYLFDLCFALEHLHTREYLTEFHSKVAIADLLKYKYANDLLGKSEDGEPVQLEEYKVNFFLIKHCLLNKRTLKQKDILLFELIQSIEMKELVSREGLTSIIDNLSMSVIKYQEDTINLIFQALTEHHLIVLTSFILALKKIVSRITLEDVYLQYINLIKTFGIVKLEILNVGVMLKELVATNVLLQYFEGKKTFYGLQGSQRVVLEALKKYSEMAKINSEFKIYVSKLELNF